MRRKLNRETKAAVQKPGDMQRFALTTPADGQYLFERPDPEYSGVCVFAYGPDMELLPHEADEVYLHAGETLRFIAISDHFLVLEGEGYGLGIYAGEAPVSETFPDMDGDNEISANDAQVVLLAYAEMLSGNPSGLTPEQEAAADVNGDSEITALDAQYILAYYLQNTVLSNPRIVG